MLKLSSSTALTLPRLLHYLNSVDGDYDLRGPDSLHVRILEQGADGLYLGLSSAGSPLSVRSVRCEMSSANLDGRGRISLVCKGLKMPVMAISADDDAKSLTLHSHTSRFWKAGPPEQTGIPIDPQSNCLSGALSGSLPGPSLDHILSRQGDDGGSADLTIDDLIFILDILDDDARILDRSAYPIVAAAADRQYLTLTAARDTPRLAGELLKKLIRLSPWRQNRNIRLLGFERYQAIQTVHVLGNRKLAVINPTSPDRPGLVRVLLDQKYRMDMLDFPPIPASGEMPQDQAAGPKHLIPSANSLTGSPKGIYLDFSE